MTQSTISNKQVLKLSAILKYQASKDFKHYKISQAGLIGMAGIGLSSLSLSFISSINHWQELAQTSTAVSLYSTLGFAGISGIKNRYELATFEKETLSNHIINAFLCGADFSQCQNIYQVVDIVSKCFLNSQPSDNNQSEIITLYNHFYNNSTACHICESALNSNFSQKDQYKIEQMTDSIYSFIYQKHLIQSNQMQISQPTNDSYPQTDQSMFFSKKEEVNTFGSEQEDYQNFCQDTEMCKEIPLQQQ